MILRKPYAFLIRHFQKINLALFLLAVYIIYKNLTFLGMVREYLTTKYYNPIVTPMSDYTSFFFYLGIVSIVVICSVLIYLLYYKKKPVIVYGLTILEYVAVAISFGFAASYFNELGFNVINMQQALLVRDVLFIVSIPQYALLIVLANRALGLDLKKFGFREDEEYLEIQEEDREEFEVEVGLDTHNIRRKLKQKLRYLKYFIVEHRVVISIIAFIVLISGSIYTYQVLIIENRVYGIGDTFRANSYEIKINKIYFTGKDYAGNVINDEKRKYLVVDLNIKNVVNQKMTVSTEKFILTANHRYYTPIKTHDKYFEDLGKGYQGEELEPGKDNNYLLVFEIKPDDFGSPYTLYYQEVQGANKLKLRKINTTITDISEYSNEITKNLKENIQINLYNGSSTEFVINDYQIVDELTYLYTSCYVWDCRVYEGKLKASSFSGNNTLLKMNYTSNQTGRALSSYFAKQSKLIYEVNGVQKKVDLKLPLSREWKGNYVYLLIPKEAMNSNQLAFEFVVRDQVYYYYLKGGEANATK